MQKIKVSIILPVFNCEEYIEDCLNSLLSQTFKNFEIIVINDYCDDSTIEKVGQFSNSQIRIIDNRGHKGIAACLNLGIQNSRGEYIARMDADDISVKDRLERQVSFLDRNDEIDVLGSRFREFGQKDNICILPSEHEDIAISLLSGSIFCHPSVMMRKRLFRDYSYKEQYNSAEDYKLWVEMAIGGVRFHILEDILLLKRAHKNRISVIERDRQIVLTDIIRREYFESKYKFLDTEELNVICPCRNDVNWDIQRFSLVISKIKLNSTDSSLSKKEIKLIYRDTIYRLDPYLNFKQFINLLRYPYPYTSLKLIDVLRLFRRTFYFYDTKYK